MLGQIVFFFMFLHLFNIVMKFLFIQYNTSISSNLLVSSINSFILLQNPFLINTILVIFIIIIILSNKIP